MKKALLVWGGWDGHEPKECTQIAAEILEQNGFETQISGFVKSYDNCDKLKALDLIVQCISMGQINEQQEKNLLQAVRNGVGFAGWHGGITDAFRTNTDYQFMIGGQFVYHPLKLIDFKVNITKPNDPITAGLSDFMMTDTEQYYMHVDPNNEVLATTTFTGLYDGVDWVKDVVMPAVWKKTYGKGRIFYCSIGHAAKDFDVPEFKEIMKRGMLWTAGG